MLLPSFQEMLGTLIAEPSVSCACADFDQGNLRVVEHLAGWLEGLGFAVEVLPLPDKPGKGNLIATLGRETAALSWPGIRIPCPLTSRAGAWTPSS